MPQYSGECGRSQFGKIRIPPRNELDARDAVFGPDGGDAHILAQRLRYALDNDVPRASLVATITAQRLELLQKERHEVKGEMRRTPATVAARGRAEYSTPKLMLVVGLCVASAVGSVVSIIVMTEWVLRSSSGLFSQDTLGAVLFSCMPVLGAILLKCYELRLSPRARWLYATILFGAGLSSLSTWLLCAAVSFGPDTGGLLAALTQTRADFPTGVVLLIATCVCDLTFGASFLSAIGLLLSNPGAAGTKPNPAYVLLHHEKCRLERLIADTEERHADAKAYLAHAQIGEELTRLEADATVNRTREAFDLIQVAARTFAMAYFLTGKGGF